MVEALYGVEFLSNSEGIGYGVAVLETNRILGGDTSFVYIGEYEIENGVIYAKIKCTNDREVKESIFGEINKFNLELTGKIARDEFILQGHMVEHPSHKIAVKLTRRAELP